MMFLVFVNNTSRMFDSVLKVSLWDFWLQYLPSSWRHCPLNPPDLGGFDGTQPIAYADGFCFLNVVSTSHFLSLFRDNLDKCQNILPDIVNIRTIGCIQENVSPCKRGLKIFISAIWNTATVATFSSTQTFLWNFKIRGKPKMFIFFPS